MTTRPRDRRNRKWRSLAGAVGLFVQVSPRTKAILTALQDERGGQRVSYGAVIEKLAEPFAGLVAAKHEVRK